MRRIFLAGAGWPAPVLEAPEPEEGWSLLEGAVERVLRRVMKRRRRLLGMQSSRKRGEVSTRAGRNFRSSLLPALEAAMLFVDVLRKADPCLPPRSQVFL